MVQKARLEARLNIVQFASILLTDTAALIRAMSHCHLLRPI